MQSNGNLWKHKTYWNAVPQGDIKRKIVTSWLVRTAKRVEFTIWHLNWGDINVLCQILLWGTSDNTTATRYSWEIVSTFLNVRITHKDCCMLSHTNLCVQLFFSFLNTDFLVIVTDFFLFSRTPNIEDNIPITQHRNTSMEMSSTP